MFSCKSLAACLNWTNERFEAVLDGLMRSDMHLAVVSPLEHLVTDGTFVQA